jgi:hypothetical protein
MDDHIISVLVLIGLAVVGAGNRLGERRAPDRSGPTAFLVRPSLSEAGPAHEPFGSAPLPRLVTTAWE